MKTTKQLIGMAVFAIIALALICLSVTSCPEPVPSHTHEWGAWVQTKTPTETTEGEETRTCTTCGETETRSIAKHVHDWGDWTVTTPATCTTTGVETRTCKIDATHTETQTIAELGHDWGEWMQTTAPTYTTEGEETRTCKHDATYKETRPIYKTSFDDLGTWLTSQSANTVTTPYTIKLNIANLTGIRDILNAAPGKYVYLDLSGSTIRNITSQAFGTGYPDYIGSPTLTGITIPNSVTLIGTRAFRDCTSLTSVTIPDSVTFIGQEAFAGCTSLASITISDSVTRMSNYVFDETAWLNNQSDGLIYIGKIAFIYKGTMPANTSIILLDGTKGIAGSAFMNCSSLASIAIPNSVTSIGPAAFMNCSSLTSVTIPDSVTSIEGQAFQDCNSLTAINVDAGNSTYTSENGVLYNKNKTTINQYPAGKAGTTFTIPNTITDIEPWAFGGCTSLASVTIPNSVTSIGQQAFQDCTSLTSI